MAPSVAPMQLLVSIVERGKGRELREHYRQFGLIHHNQAAGHGTAASHLLDALGFGTSERDIILTLGPKDTMLQLVYHLKDEDRSKLGTPGIAFTLNLSGMSAIFPMTFLFAAFLTVFSSKFTSVTKVCQRIQSLIDNKNNIAAAASVSAVRTAIWDIFFTAETDMSISTFSRFYNNCCSVCKHNFLL